MAQARERIDRRSDACSECARGAHERRGMREARAIGRTHRDLPETLIPDTVGRRGQLPDAERSRGQLADARRDEGTSGRRVRETMNRKTDLVEGVDALVDAVVEGLQLADVHFGRFHFSASFWARTVIYNVKIGGRGARDNSGNQGF